MMNNDEITLLAYELYLDEYSKLKEPDYYYLIDDPSLNILRKLNYREFKFNRHFYKRIIDKSKLKLKIINLIDETI